MLNYPGKPFCAHPPEGGVVQKRFFLLLVFLVRIPLHPIATECLNLENSSNCPDSTNARGYYSCSVPDLDLFLVR